VNKDSAEPDAIADRLRASNKNKGVRFIVGSFMDFKYLSGFDLPSKHSINLGAPLQAPAVSHPGANAWARESCTTKSGLHLNLGRLGLY
jgi:hypothetical protein